MTFEIPAGETARKGKPMDEAEKPHDRLARAVAADLESVDATIRARMASENAPRIPEVTAHLVGAGGKRIRPMLTLASARLMGDRSGHAVALAATVEFIHTATLLHDDVVDESATRRGRPTANLLWDNKSSVLVGDYLFARAFQLMVETGSLRVLGILSDAAATIAEGEVLQLAAAGNLATTEDTYFRIVRGKTAALFSAATEVGGVIADASETEIRALWTYGDALGVAFQIADDLIDWMEGTGKGLGDDFREGKMTLPIIRAVARGTDADRAFWTRTIGQRQIRDDDLGEAAARLAATGALESVRETAVAWADTAKAALERLPQDPLREMLADLAEFVVERIR